MVKNVKNVKKMGRLRECGLVVVGLLLGGLFSGLCAQANPEVYLGDVKNELKKKWPGNRTINLVFHGHSVPAGFFKLRW